MAKKVKDFEYEFDPVKESKDGRESAVVWTTSSLNKAVEAINQGLPLKANPFIGKVTQLLKPDLVYKRTSEEIEDYIHCKEDPVYFASKCFLMSPKGLTAVTLRDYQADYLRHLIKNRFSIFLSCRQSGKSTTTAIFCLWHILFNTDKMGLILSKSGPAGRDLLAKIKDMFRYLPYHLKAGIMKWNQSEISFDNNSSISTEAFSDTAGLGKTINFLILDECAWMDAKQFPLFYENVIPTVTTQPDATVAIMSTQNGRNHFYKLWQNAVTGKSGYGAMKVDWWQVPQWNPKTQMWEKRDDRWRQKMIGILGSEESFNYQYGTSFTSSNNCLCTKDTMARLHTHEILYEAVNPEEEEFVFDNSHCLYLDPKYDRRKLKTGWFVVLVDLAEGGGGDYTVFNILEVIDRNTFSQIGYWKSNEVEFEKASLAFWTMFGSLFAPNHCLVSLEWNTYGALFYNYVKSFNEHDFKIDEYGYRFSMIDPAYDGEFPVTEIVHYKKGSQDEEVAGISKNAKTVPGIRFNASNKKMACALLKIMIEKGEVRINDLLTISELDNFEDKDGNGSYKASYGHDDIIMTFCQLPMLRNTAKWKEFIEDFESEASLSGISSSLAQYDGSYLDASYFSDTLNAFPSSFGSLFQDKTMHF